MPVPLGLISTLNSKSLDTFTDPLSNTLPDSFESWELRDEFGNELPAGWSDDLTGDFVNSFFVTKTTNNVTDGNLAVEIDSRSQGHMSIYKRFNLTDINTVSVDYTVTMAQSDDVGFRFTIEDNNNNQIDRVEKNGEQSGTESIDLSQTINADKDNAKIILTATSNVGKQNTDASTVITDNLRSS